VKWSLSGSYTIFPDEDGYAAADVKVAVGQDEETGELILSGVIAAGTELLAVAKLNAFRTAVLLAEGFNANSRIRNQLDKGYLNTDDTAGANVFTALTFSETYRKRAANVLSTTLTITDVDDTRSGMINRTYAGSVVSSGSTDSAAYVSALLQAQLLGDNKHSFRLSGRVVRADRKINDAPNEHVCVEFAYEYQIKGERGYAEVGSTTDLQTFGEDAESVSGFIVARDLNTARSLYLSQVRNAYNSRLIRSEKTSDSKILIESGSYLGAFLGTGTFQSMFVRYKFEFQVFKTKTSGYAIKYGLEVAIDYTRLIKESTVEGSFFGTDALLADVQNRVAGNPLDVFLAALNFGNLLRDSRKASSDKVGTTINQALSVAFTNSYIAKLTSGAQILECHISEDSPMGGRGFRIGNEA
jgi:hypothetical protein